MSELVWRPLMIVIEGIDGSGKSTQLELLHRRFAQNSQPAVIHHEPTEGHIGRLIRSVLNGTITMDPSVVAALYLADRLDHITRPDTGMKAHMQDGSHVISSRYYFSSFAFQGEFVPMNWLVNANSLCKQMLTADLTIYIDIDPEITIERLKTTRQNLDIYENIEKQRRVHQDFLKAFNTYGAGERIRLIDGSQTIDTIHEAIWEEVLNVPGIRQKQ